MLLSLLMFVLLRFRAANAMRMCGHARPDRDGFMNFLSRAIDCHKISAGVHNKSSLIEKTVTLKNLGIFIDKFIRSSKKFPHFVYDDATLFSEQQGTTTFLRIIGD
jgi:hypothetical protein